MEMSRDGTPEDARKAEAPIKGRGAASRVAGRFEARALRGEDDGWGSVYEDLAEAAKVVKGKKVAQGVEFYLAAASAETQERAEREGVWSALVEAGAIVLPPGCGTCIGLGAGTIKKGEVGISATNRNFEGRMGDREGLVYLGSPAVVAASAVAGRICSPVQYGDEKVRFAVRQSSKAAKQQIGWCGCDCRVS